MKEQPLVSILVITYNSDKYVLETLESAKAQTYPNLELIISDDGSKDQTVELCREWLVQNKARFARTELITVTANTGIPANCNRGVKAAKGKWIKFIAGDDILYKTCIGDFMQYASADPEINIIESASQFFSITDNKVNYRKVHNSHKELFFSPLSSSQMQYNLLLRHNFIHAPSVILSKKVIEEAAGFDEEFPFLEDYPLWLKITKAGYKIYFLNKITVLYRIHDDSVYSSVSKKKIFNDFYIKERGVHKKYVSPNIGKLEKTLKDIEFYRKYLLDNAGLNKKNLFCKIIYLGTLKVSPLYLYNKFIKRNV